MSADVRRVVARLCGRILSHSLGSPEESPTSSYFLAISTSVRPRFKRKDARLGEGHCTLAGQHFHAPLWSFDHAELMWYAT